MSQKQGRWLQSIGARDSSHFFSNLVCYCKEESLWEFTMIPNSNCGGFLGTGSSRSGTWANDLSVKMLSEETSKGVAKGGQKRNGSQEVYDFR